MNNHNIAQALADTVGQNQDRTALIVKAFSGYRSWSFRTLNNTINAYAHEFISQGIDKGDRVMLMVKPSLEFVSITFALFKIGAIVILIDPGMGYTNLLKCIAQVKPTVFIGIPKAHLFKLLFPKPFQTIRKSICVGSSLGLFGRNFSANRVAALLQGEGKAALPVTMAAREDPAAILFTTGSTGPPKGVRYDHGIFQAQLALIREYYGITPADVDLPAFPLFALFSIALGACAVIPDMDPARPAQVNPSKFVRSIIDGKVTYSFGSPAIWNVVSQYCINNEIILPSLKKILMAGAPISGELIMRLKRTLSQEAEIHTPYGATESLPITSMTGTEILEETWEMTRDGQGTCIGRPLPGIDIAIISITDDPVPHWRDDLNLAAGKIGEIVVKGPVVTRAYENNNQETRLAKIMDGNGIWHRMGDVGYFDKKGRLWFCGRKAHRVVTADKTLFTIQCEAIANEHPAVFRSALVGIGPRNQQVPVIIIEPRDKPENPDYLLNEVRKMIKRHRLTSSIEHFLIYPKFPVDIRHNAKIFREQLADWAARQIKHLPRQVS